MKCILGVLLLASLAACSPSIKTEGNDKVSIKFDNYSHSSTTLRPLADAECAKFNRKAVFTETTMDTDFVSFLTKWPLYAHYKCVSRN